ncbi:hypothetical protein QJS83_03350 [Bdellovibrio sp. 22V]|uniref:hypothetical protein n=1 Tax=Bdellovibrio TaxID=958 RepID=UPI0025437961|nr:hypothetical protein [Bdellovibrio sp. 22V]WII72906.1 hypothetical protein QJS83_03350 [Bdellovibrio sp. 22V]
MRSAIFALALPSLFSLTASAQELSPQSLFNRCYIQLTGKPVPLNHSLMNQVKSGKINALDACRTILHKGQLSASGEVNRNDAEAKAVLNTFYSFHRTWFTSNNLDTISGYNSGEHNGTVDIYDATEPALSVTYSVFGAGQKYEQTLRRTTGVKAIRVEDEAIKARQKWIGSHAGRFMANNLDMQNSLFSFRDPTKVFTTVSRNINRHVAVFKSMPTIQVGDLVGIRPISDQFNVPNISLKPQGDSRSDKGSLDENLNYSYEFFQNYGGGVIGSPIYLLQYFGHSFNMKFNGGSKVARRWSQQNMESFLCASLPALRESDVTQFVDAKSSLAFRNSTSCVMCHATLDPMAYTARNLTTGAMDIFRVTQNGDVTRDADGKQINPPPAFVRNAVAITSYKASKASVAGWPSEAVADFHLQKPTGRLYFRSVTGALINKPVTNMADLGKAMSETEDYYLCAAKRYFEFMTGIQVPLYDRTDPRNSELNRSLSKEAKEDRAYVESLAKVLAGNGSVLEVVEEIMRSPYYTKENFR